MDRTKNLYRAYLPKELCPAQPMEASEKVPKPYRPRHPVFQAILKLESDKRNISILSLEACLVCFMLSQA